MRSNEFPGTLLPSFGGSERIRATRNVFFTNDQNVSKSPNISENVFLKIYLFKEIV
jgi:hypothetical protein